MSHAHTRRRMRDSSSSALRTAFPSTSSVLSGLRSSYENIVHSSEWVKSLTGMALTLA
jgi:hypothetical protein